MSDVPVGVQDELVELQLERGSVVSSEEDQKAIKEYILEELNGVATNVERNGYMDKVKKWRRQREARPEAERKDFPWEGASNVVVPITMTNTNALYAAMLGSLSGRKPFWTVDGAIGGQTGSQAEALTKFLEAMANSPYHLNLYPAMKDILYDLVSIGTKFIKIPWETRTWSFKKVSAGGALADVNKIVKNSPSIIPLEVEDFFTRPFWSDIQRAPWVATRNFLFEHELLHRQAEGLFLDVEPVLGGGDQDIPEEKLESLRRQGIDPKGDTKMYVIYEVYLFWDVDGDGVPEDIILWIDPVSETILRSEINDLGIRPLVRMTYLPRPGSLYGIGVGWIMEHMQDEIDTLHNMRIDGGQLSTLQMYVTKKGSGLQQGTRFRPLKNIQVDDPSKDFIPIKFPDIGYSVLQMEMMAKEYADRGTGASDAMLGFESRATSARTTASGTMFLAQQGGRVRDAIQENCVDGFSNLGQVVVFQCVRNRDFIKDQFYLIPEEYHQSLEEAFSLEVEEIPASFRFGVTTTDIQKTEEAKRQSILQLTQLYTLYGQQVFQLLPMVYSPQAQIPEEIKLVAGKFFVGATNLMEKVFEFFGERDTDEYLPYIQDLEMLIDAIDMQKAQVVGRVKGASTENRGEVGAPAGGASRDRGLPVGPAMAQGGGDLGGGAGGAPGGAGAV